MMINKIKKLLSSLTLGSVAVAQAQEAPPVDVNKPVENPNLLAAIEALTVDQSDTAKDRLLRELNRSNYLAVIITDELHTSPSDSEGRTTVQKDSVIKFIATSDEAGNPYLPLFTDWNAIGEYLGRDKQHSTIILPPSDAWYMALSGGYTGVVINPARNALPLNLDQIKYLKEKNNPNQSSHTTPASAPR